jgi:uncharacterized membrane protein
MSKQSSPPATPLGKLIRILPWILVICSAIGILASAVITQEKFDLATNPHYQPVCDLNPIISCGSVMKSDEAHAFGFMNTYIGLIGFPVVLAIGMGMLAGAKFKRWYWLGLVFAYWLLFESMYRIHALCPWCLTVDVVLTITWWYVTLFNFYTGNLRWPGHLRAIGWLHAAGRFVKRHHIDILVTWFLLVIALILHHFWYYFGSHL